MSCAYKDIFGKPNEGLHSYRFLNIAVVDLLMTIAFAKWFSYYYEYNFALVFFILLIISILSHWLFCVDTPLTVAILGESNKVPENID